MFERFTETARRSVFFARYEASQFGSESIEPEHLLLGILRTNETLTMRLLLSLDKVEALRDQLAKQIPQQSAKIPLSVDLPLSQTCRRVLAYASEECERLNQNHIGAEHLLLGLSREEACLAAKVMVEHGLTRQKLQEEAARAAEKPGLPRSEELTPIEKVARDLGAATRSGELAPLIGRDREVERLMRILSRRTRNNAALIGESGVGKTAIVQGFAQRVIDSNVKSYLAGRPILSIDAAQLIAPRRPDKKLFQVTTENHVILCVEGLFDLAGTGSGWGVTEAIRVLEPHLSHGELQCIATGTPAGLRQTNERAAALARHFEVIHVLPPAEEEARRIVLAAKDQLEKFHAVVFGEDAVDMALAASRRFLPHRQLPERAIDLLDEAGARVKLRRETEPSEIVHIRQHLRRIAREMENAIGNHEFEKARRCSEEEKVERAKLMRLKEEFGPIRDNRVTAQDVIEGVAGRIGIPVAAIQRLLAKESEEELERISKQLIPHLPAEGQDWVAGLAAYLAACSSEEAEKLAEAIRAAKNRT